ncbi:zinc ribbon domain-containing protein [bacterium]|nr:zinc ribbon domain-containing protein [bacterium]
MKIFKFTLPLLLLGAIAFSFPTDIPYTIEGLLNKMNNSLEKVKNPNFSKTYIPPSIVPYAIEKTDGKFAYFDIQIYRPHPITPRPGYHSVIIYTPVPYYPPVAYIPPSIICQQMPNYLDILLLKELLEAKDELRETQKEVEKLKEKMEQLEDKNICPTCKRAVDPNWTYCPYDGTPLNKGSRKELKDEEKEKIELYVETLANVYLQETDRKGFLAVELSSLEGLSEEGQKEVINRLKARLNSQDVYSLADVKSDKDKFYFDEQGRITGAKNGIVVLVKLVNYNEGKAQLKVVCWKASDWMTLIPYEARFVDGKWQLTKPSAT